MKRGMRRVRRSCPDRVTTGTRCALIRKLILLAALTFGATDAQAENGLFYLGAGVVHNSVTDLTPLGNPPPIDLKNTTWKAFVGVRPLNWLAAELDYIDLGSGSTSTPRTARPTLTSRVPAAAHMPPMRSAFCRFRCR